MATSLVTSQLVLEGAGLKKEAQLQLYIALTAMHLILIMKNRSSEEQDQIAKQVCEEYMHNKKEIVEIGAWTGADVEVGFQLIRHDRKE